jgi:hypothetical protein
MAQETVEDTRPRWQSPTLRELGNLRDFVRAGQGCGKTGPNIDGVSGANDERRRPGQSGGGSCGSL